MQARRIVLASSCPFMRTLSATEAISPAIQRTKDILFRRFRKGRGWKLCATAYVCRMGTLFFPFPLIYLVFLPVVARSMNNAFAIGFVVLLLAATAFFVWIFHLCSRLQFAYFDIIVNRGEFVAPAWRKYGPQSRTWTWFKVWIGLAATLVLLIPILASMPKLLPMLREIFSVHPGQPPSPKLIVLIYAAELLFMAVYGIAYIACSLMTDFVLPSLALENTGIREGLRRMLALLRQETGEFLLFVLLRLGLGICAYVGILIAWEIVLILSTLIVGGIAFALGYLLHLAGIPSAVLIALAIILGVLWYLFHVGIVMVYAFGIVLTFLDAYPLYFLGGRYPLLGDLMDRSELPPMDPYSPLGLSPSPGSFPPPPPPFAG